MGVIRSKRNRFFETLFSMYITYILKRNFSFIHVAGESLVFARDTTLPTIIFANHSNWWDGFVMFECARRRWRIDSHLMMDIEQMRKYSFFKWLGVFSVDRNSPKSAVESINHAVDLLIGTGNILWIFPQGVLLPNDVRPIHFYQGTARIVEKLGRVNILCLALRYEFRKEQRPEIFLRFSNLQHLESPIDAGLLTQRMQTSMEQELDSLRNDVICGAMSEFSPMMSGRKSRNAIVDLFIAEPSAR